MVPVNFLAVVLSAVAALFIGFLWFGPVFGKQWISVMGFTKEQMDAAMKKGMASSYLSMFVAALVMAFVLAHAIIFADSYLGMSGIAGGIVVACANWLGFVAPVFLGAVIWEGKPWKWWFLNAGYYLVDLVVMGIILSVWQ